MDVNFEQKSRRLLRDSREVFVLCGVEVKPQQRATNLARRVRAHVTRTRRSSRVNFFTPTCVIPTLTSTQCVHTLVWCRANGVLDAHFMDCSAVPSWHCSFFFAPVKLPVSVPVFDMCVPKTPVCCARWEWSLGCKNLSDKTPFHSQLRGMDVARCSTLTSHSNMFFLPTDALPPRTHGRPLRSWVFVSAIFVLCCGPRR